MALIVDPDDLNQGAVTTPTDAVWGAPTGREVTITSAGSELPDLEANVYFEVRDHPDAENNGLYRVDELNPSVGSISAFKITGVAPIADAGGRTVRIFGTTATPKSVHFDVEARGIYLLEQGNLSTDGVTLQALYSFIKLRWKDDNDLIKHPFPMIAITPEQFEFISDWNPVDSVNIGPFATATQGFDWGDGTGAGGADELTNNDPGTPSWIINGFRIGDEVVVRNSEFEPDQTITITDITGAGNETIEFAAGTVSGSNTDDNTLFVKGAIRSRKLIRTGGWSEVAELNSLLLRQYPNCTTLGTFEDPANDTAYFQFGDDPTDTAAAQDFDFPGPVNEAVLSYQANVAGPDGGSGFDVTVDTPVAGTDRLTRQDGGDFIADGFQVGGQVTIRLAEDAQNNGTFLIVALTTSTMDLQAQGGGDPGMVAPTGGDQTMVLDINNRNQFRPRLRIRDADTNGKTYDASDLPAIGITGPDDFNNRVFRFPLANATDLKIVETDANIDANSPYTEIVIRYFDQAFSRDVDSATNRDFGIVIDVGTHSGVDGSTTALGSTLSTAEGGIIDDGRYEGGTLRMHEGSDENTVFTIATGGGAVTPTTVSIAPSQFAATESNLSFTIQRASPVVASAEEIYEFVQRQLRLNADIDETDQVVTGRTADELLRFVGDALEAGQGIPVNPNGGGSGVIIEGFDTNDTNRLTFFDNTGTARTFPFVAAGTIQFNANLVNDTGPAEYFMFYEYTERFTNTGFGLSAASGDTATLDSSVTDLVAELADGDYIRLTGFTDDANNGIWILTGSPAGTGPWTAPVRKVDGETVSNESAGASISLDKNPIDSPDAILVDDNSGSDISGIIGGSSVPFDYDYDNNTQGGRTPGTDADIVIRALGEDTAAFVEVFGTITRATGLLFSVVAPLERNFTNPA